MIIFILSFICLLLALYIWKKRRESSTSYIKETIDFFSSHNTEWLSSEQLELFSSCTSSDCYSSKISSLSAPSLIIDMLVGQPLKYIWRDRNTDELIHYLMSLKHNKVNYQNSVLGHSSLYTDDFGEWSQGQDVIDTFIQMNK